MGKTRTTDTLNIFYKKMRATKSQGNKERKEGERARNKGQRGEKSRKKRMEWSIYFIS